MHPFQVYFDGKCVLCSKEINFYRKKSGAAAIDWVDISRPEFNASSEGLDPEEVMRIFHVRDETGALITGVDGFIEIWRRLPELAYWARLAKLPGVRLAMKLGYLAFVRARPFLPRHPDECADGYCNKSRPARP